MPILIDLLWQLAGAAASYAVNQILAGHGPNSGNPWPAILSLAQVLDGQNSINNELISSARALNIAWDTADNLVKRIDGQFSQAASNWDRAMLWIVNGIIPGSIKAATNRAWGGIRGVRSQLAYDQKQIKYLWQSVDATVKWDDHIVAPRLKAWDRFIALWSKRYQRPINALADWYAHPGHLSTRLASTMAPDIVGQLAQPKARGLVDRLWLILLGRATDVTGKLDQAAVAVLNSGSY